MALRLITTPAVPVITLGEAKVHLSVDHADHDDLITSMISCATAMFDGSPGELNRALIHQVWELTLPAFPCGAIRLPLSPIAEVVEVKHLDSDGDLVTLTGWTATLGERAFLIAADGSSWPSAGVSPEAVRVRFKAGYGASAEDVPAALKVAIKIVIGDLYANRESSGAASAVIVPTVDRLIAPYRFWPC